MGGLLVADYVYYELLGGGDPVVALEAFVPVLHDVVEEVDYGAAVDRLGADEPDHEVFVHRREDSEEVLRKRGRGRPGWPTTGVSSAPEQGSAGTRRPRVEWPHGTPRYLAMNLAASFDPYFTSCLAASILWHSSAPSILSSMTSRKKSMMRRPSSVFSRTMSARVGGFRSSAVVVVSA